ncbi:MAG: transcriptional regulator [Ruminiclostridium sp.]|nr:transcriptional regulator [Ruminococcus sp.]MBP3854253.1 transcriptional regulator [Ruminiclostridium sp.]
MTNEKVFYKAEDVCTILSVSRPTAYRIIKKLNEELESMGYMVINGRVPVKFFNEKFYCGYTESKND